MNRACYIALGIFWWHLEDHLFCDLSFMGTFYLHLLYFENCVLNQNTLYIVFIDVLLRTASSVLLWELYLDGWKFLQGNDRVVHNYVFLPISSIHCLHSYSQPHPLIVSVGTLLFIIKTQTWIWMLHYLTFKQWSFKFHSGNNPTNFTLHAFTFSWRLYRKC